MIPDFDMYFQNAPPAVAVDRIWQAWTALTDYDVNRWRLPLPPWAHRRYDDTPDRAWTTVKRVLADSDPHQPICIYLHVPFCSRKCGFCDSYSFKLGAHQAERIQEYVSRLCDELRVWSAAGMLAARPVSTVHLGGGTPPFIGAAGLRQIVDCCRSHFNITAATEWAVETTVESLTCDMVGALHDFGFRRLHIGVQSLEDNVRAAIGRRRPAAEALDSIRQTRALGWIVSVDMVCGLPGQTIAGFMDGLAALLEAGANGVSLYELLIYPQNRRWAEQYGLLQRSHLPNYWMLLAGVLYLEARGLRKNLFNHWADALDKNIYFTFPQRGEDLLAVGAIADGVFGDYHYRHPRYAPYLNVPAPALEGGLWKTPAERQLWPLMTALLSGCIPAYWRAALAAVDGGLIERWLRNGLVVPDDAGGLLLAAGGSWFAGNMLAELPAPCDTVSPQGTRTPA